MIQAPTVTAHSVIPADGPQVIIDGNDNWKGNPIVAGDIIQVATGSYAQIVFRDLMTGTGANPIIIENTGGLVTITGSGYTDSIIFTGQSGQYCNWVFLQGDNSASGGVYGTKNYGIFCQKNVDIRTGSNLRLSGLRVDGKIEAKQDINTTTPMEDIRIFENWLNGSTVESIYFGSGNFVYGVAKYEMIGGRIYNNLIESGGEGIQVRAIRSSDPVLVYGNTIAATQGWTSTNFDALSFEQGCHIYCYGNLIIDSNGRHLRWGDGQRDPDFTSKIYNNVFLRAGVDLTGLTNAEDALLIQNNSGNVDVFYNTIISTHATGYGIQWSAGAPVTGGSVFGNIILDTGLGAVDGGTIYDNLTDTVANSEDSIAYAVGDLDFVDSGNDDYHLQAASPAIGYATVPGAAPADDYDGEARDVNPDVGAFEYIAPSGPPATPDTKVTVFNAQLVATLSSDGKPDKTYIATMIVERIL